MATMDQPASPVTARLPAAQRKGRLSFLLRWETLLIVLLFATSAVNAQLSSHFLSLRNFSTMAVTFMPVGLMVLPMTFIILIAGIDLSVASVLGATSVVMGLLFQQGLNIWLAAIAALALGGLAGLINGVAIAGLRLPGLIVTLATLALFRGIAYGLIGENAVYGFPDAFVFLGRGFVPGTQIPFPIAIFAMCAAVFTLVLHRTTFGRTIYAIGNNEPASRYSGVAVDRVVLTLFILSSVMSALAGIIMAARFNSTRGDAATGMELDVITAVLLGGVSVFGGKGTMVGPIIALFLIGEVRYGMDLQNLSAQEQTIAIGLLLILSVLVNELFRRKWVWRRR